SSIPEAEQIIEEEDSHEEKLIAMLQEEHLQYVGSVVLGLNDALVELTGTLAGLTFALKDTRIIAMVGLITGIAASLSMGASEYLSTRSENPEDNALKSALYTGVAYVITVFLLILPYLLLNSYLFALIFTVVIAILIILVFNFYVSVARDLDFKKRFTEMAAISLGVALLSFGIGILVRVFLGVDV
ncbi:MAG TPA: VIT1/CCC1 transporter family protein, partial [Halanaerobiales bacterium]|nr:VIT1/CCC1 transporter family protein [Halanaerobiales bacterium]